jgi:hypothetical protein
MLSAVATERKLKRSRANLILPYYAESILWDSIHATFFVITQNFVFNVFESGECYQLSVPNVN